MKVDEAEAALINLLEQNGVDLERSSEGAVDVLQVWEVFKSFAALLVECEGDLLLFQCGIFDFTGQEMFHFEFLRQFEIYIDEEYDHMEQLHCEFLFEPNDELKNLETTLWSFDEETREEYPLEDFFQRVEGLNEFQAVPSKYRPVAFELYQEEV